MAAAPEAEIPPGANAAVGDDAIPPVRIAEESLSDRARDWKKDYEAWRRDRLDRVQASARVWLGVLTTLLGLLGSVVLFKGGSLVTGVTTAGWFQGILIALVAGVFGAAVLAVIAGGVATWGGLKDIVPSAADGTETGEPAHGRSGQERVAWLPQWWAASRWRRAIAPAWQRLRAWWRRRKMGALTFILVAAGIEKGERDKALRLVERSRGGESERRSGEDWQRYQENVIQNADRNRTFLHASRMLGVVAAATIALLAIVAVIAGTVYPAPPMVIVVRHGQVSCGTVPTYARETGITQVISVSNC